MSRKKQEFPPLSEEHLMVVPYGDPRCRICRLPVDDLKKVHELRFTKNFTYKQIREYLKATLSLGEDFTRIGAHFTKHLNTTKQLVKPSVQVLATVLDSLQPGTKVRSNQELDKAYSRLTSMADIFTRRIEELLGQVQIRLDNPELAKKDKETLDRIPLLPLLQQLSSLMREAQGQVKDVSALRAPKVVVAQFLESAMNQIITDVNGVLEMLCSMLQTNLTTVLKEGQPVTDEVFLKVFQIVAVEYKNRMLAIKRENMAKALATLNELEKII